MEYYYVETAIGYAVPETFGQLVKVVDTLTAKGFEIEGIALIVEK